MQGKGGKNNKEANRLGTKGECESVQVFSERKLQHPLLKDRDDGRKEEFKNEPEGKRNHRSIAMVRGGKKSHMQGGSEKTKDEKRYVGREEEPRRQNAVNFRSGRHH